MAFELDFADIQTIEPETPVAQPFELDLADVQTVEDSMFELDPAEIETVETESVQGFELDLADIQIVEEAPQLGFIPQAVQEEAKAIPAFVGGATEAIKQLPKNIVDVTVSGFRSLKKLLSKKGREPIIEQTLRALRTGDKAYQTVDHLVQDQLAKGNLTKEDLQEYQESVQEEEERLKPWQDREASKALVDSISFLLPGNIAQRAVSFGITRFAKYVGLRQEGLKPEEAGETIGADVGTYAAFEGVHQLARLAWKKATIKNEKVWEADAQSVQAAVKDAVVPEGVENPILTMFPNAEKEGVRLRATQYREWVKPIRERIKGTEPKVTKFIGPKGVVEREVLETPAIKIAKERGVGPRVAEAAERIRPSEVTSVQQIPKTDIERMNIAIKEAMPGRRGEIAVTTSIFPEWNQGRPKSQTLPIFEKFLKGEKIDKRQQKTLLNIYEDFKNSPEELLGEQYKQENLLEQFKEFTPQGLQELTVPENLDKIMPVINDKASEGYIEDYTKEEVLATLRELGATVEAQVTGKPVTPAKQIIEPRLAEEGARIPIQSLTQKGVAGIQREFQKLFTAKGLLPQSIQDSIIKKRGKISKEMQNMRFANADFERSLKGLKVTPEEAAQLDQVLKGEIPLPEKFKASEKAIKNMREHIDNLSKELIESGAAQGDLQLSMQLELFPGQKLSPADLKIAIERNIGTYVTRAYQVHTDPKWVKKVLKDERYKDVRNKVRAYLRQEYEGQGFNENQIEGYLNALLNEQAVSPFVPLGSKEGSKALGILKKRKAIPKEIRELWGEYKDIPTNYTASIEKMSSLVANHQFLQEIRQKGLGEFFHKQAIVKDGVDYSFEIAGKESDTYSPLNGLYTSKDILDALTNTSEKLTPWLRHYMKGVGLTKFSKTVLSQMTHIRNFLSNPLIAIANGNYNLRRLNESWKAMSTQLANRSLPEWRDYVLRAQELGVLDESIRAGTLRDTVQDASGLNYDGFMSKTLSNWPARIAKTAGNVYQAEDNFWKIFNWENEIAKIRDHSPELTRVQAEEQAADIVRKITPTYSNVSESVKQLRRFPLVGTFVSFPAEIIRIGYNTMRLIESEIKSSNPKKRKYGYQRLIGTIMAIGGLGVTGIGLISRFFSGVDRKDMKAIHHFSPDYQKNSQLAIIGVDKDNAKYTYIDMSYTDPYNYLKRPMIALLRGEDWKSKLMESVSEAFSPFISEDILTGKALDVSRNKTKQGYPIYNPEDSGLKIAQDVLSHMWDAVEPGTITGMRRIGRGLIEDESNLYGKKYDPKLEAIAQSTGFRISKLDVKRSLAFKTKDFRRRLLNARFAGGFEDFETKKRSMMEVYDDFHKTLFYAKQLGVSENQIFSILKENGVSEKRTDYILFNDYEFVVDESLDRIRERQEERRELKQIAL